MEYIVGWISIGNRIGTFVFLNPRVQPSIIYGRFILFKGGALFNLSHAHRVTRLSDGHPVSFSVSYSLGKLVYELTATGRRRAQSP